MSFIAGYVPAPGNGVDAAHAFILRAAECAQAAGADHFGFQDASGGALVVGQRFTGGMAEAPQPYQSEDGACRLVFSGVLYNAAELQERIAPPAPALHGGEVLLGLYRHEGEAAFARLAGAYSFGLWDAARGQMFVGHDGGGVGRLYVAQDAGSVRFSSDAGLVGGPGGALSPAVVAQFLAYGTVLPGAAVGEGVWNLDPGGYLRITEGRATRWNAAAAGLEPEAAAEETLAGALARSLRGALRRGRAPAGLLVGGGLYSGVLTAALGELHGALSAVSVGLPVLNEFDGAGMACEHAAVPLRAVDVTLDHVMERLDSVLANAPSPVDDPQALLLALAVESVEPGVRTLFTGIGGRELFGDHGWDAVEPADVRALIRRPADLQATRTLDKWLRTLPPGQPLPHTDATLMVAERRAALVSAAAAARGMVAVHPFLANPALRPFARAVAEAAEAGGMRPRAALLGRLGLDLPPVLAGREPSQPSLYRELLLDACRGAVEATVAGLHRMDETVDAAEAVRLTGRYYDGEAALAPLVWRLYVLGRWLERRV
ncbi:asparagine synthase-related protein [Azospirillum sp. sgz301742]